MSFRQSRLVLAVIMAVIFGQGGLLSARAECQVTEQTMDGIKQLVLENGFVRLVVAPEKGGRIIELQSKKGKTELVRPGLGLLQDRFWQMPEGRKAWSGPYSYTFQVKKPEKTVLELCCEAEGELAYHSIVKTITLASDSSAVRVDYAYKVHENRMSPSVISPWVVNGMAVAGEENKLFVPLSDGIRTVNYSPTAPPMHQDFIYNPARGWLAAAGQKSGAGIAVTLDVSRVMAYYLWFGNNVNTMEWMCNSISIPHGEAFSTSHEFIPFHGLTAVAGVGEGVVVQLDAPETGVVGKESEVSVKIYNSVAGPLSVKVQCEKLPGRLASSVETRLLDIPADETKGFNFKWKPEADGTYAVHGEVFRGEKKICDFELPARVGKTEEPYTLPLLVKKLGDPKERYGVRGATLKPEDIWEFEFKEDIVTPHVKWARPYYRGPLRVLFLTDQMQGREIIELKQRMQMDIITPLAIVNNRQWAGDLWRVTKEMAAADLTIRLQKKDFDVIVIGGGCTIWTPEQRQMIADLVKGGVGLVWAGAPAPKELEDLLPIKAKGSARLQGWNEPVVDHPVTRLLPLSFLPETVMGRGEVMPDGMLLATAGSKKESLPLVAVMEKTGQGRVVQMNYCSSWTGLGGAYGGITPFDHSVAREPYPYWEYWYSLAARAILWAGRFDAPLQPVVKNVEFGSGQKALNTAAVTVDLEGDPAGLPGLAIELVLRGKYADELYRGKETWSGKPVTFNCGVVGNGRFFADIRVLAQDKIVAWGTHGFVHKGSVVISKVSLNKPKETDVFADGDSIGATVQIEGPVENCEVAGELYDGFERLLSRQTVPAGESVQVSLPVVCSLHPGGLFVVQVKKDGETLDHSRTFVTVLPESYVSQEWDDFMGIVWGNLGAYQRLWLAEAKAGQMRALGYNVHNCSPSWAPDDAVWPVRAGFRLLGMNAVRISSSEKNDADVRKEYAKTGDKQLLVRKPCLSDPAFKQQAARQALEATAKIKAFKPVAYNFGDEVAYAPNGLDYDFSEFALAEMREWLKTQYPSLDALNKEWEADFKDWEEIMPFTSKEAVQTGHYARWADLRLFACYSVAEFHRELIAEMQKADPRARYGLSGTQVPYPFNAMDWAQLGPVFSYLNNYGGGGELPRLHVDVAPECRLAPWRGYNSKGPECRVAVWKNYLCGQAGVSYYEQGSLLNPDLRPSQSGHDIAQATLDLRQGLAKLLLNARQDKDRIGIYFSMPSILAHNITARGGHEGHRYGWLWAIKDCGMEPKYITYLDARKNGISRKDFDVVVLPAALAMSPEEATAVEEFVAQGGCVIADGMPAVLSGHCRKLETPPLDKVFGVKQEAAYETDAPKGMLQVAGSAHGLALGTWSEGTSLLTRRIKLDGGKALGHMDETPAFIVNVYKKGKACYLNVAMNRYDGLRKTNDEAELRERVRAILTWAGATAKTPATAPDGAPVPKLEVYRYVSGDALIAGYVLNNKESCEAKLTFPRSGHLYDMRAGKYLGEGASFNVTLPGQDALMLALLPYRVKELVLKTADAKAGERATVEINLIADSKPGLHVFRLEVFGPDGKPIEALAQNIVGKEGRALARIPFALNDTPGAYKIAVRDVASGVRKETEIGLTQ